ncbi:MAG: zinc ribbon domain-containing protein, partial [Desulfobacterales bacterium]|nr:zinc ribbon domain-containing protein [Deltaproteobacteria bacterium]NNL42492.1 zinc ribbon domain-containing protein [Desulfobacterales bacterium]
MPIYEYKCEKCDCCFEKLVFGSDKEPVSCPECEARDV